MEVNCVHASPASSNHALLIPALRQRCATFTALRQNGTYGEQNQSLRFRGLFIYYDIAPVVRQQPHHRNGNHHTNKTLTFCCGKY